MSTSAQPLSQWSLADSRVRSFYDNDGLDKCVEGTQDLLDDGSLPRYHRMKTLILLAYFLEERGEMHECSEEAEWLYMIARDFYPAGVDVSADRALAPWTRSSSFLSTRRRVETTGREIQCRDTERLWRKRSR